MGEEPDADAGRHPVDPAQPHPGHRRARRSEIGCGFRADVVQLQAQPRRSRRVRGGMALRSLVLALAGLALAAPAVGARVLVVAAGERAVLVDVRTDTVAGSVAMPGRARDVAQAPDGSRALVAAGRGIVPGDLPTPGVAGPPP